MQAGQKKYRFCSRANLGSLKRYTGGMPATFLGETKIAASPKPVLCYQ